MEPLKVRISGYGGQGVVLASVIVGQAAVLDGRNAVQTQSYGSESRGGTCKADVIISDGEIYEVEPASFDCLVAMSAAAYEKYIPRLKPGGRLIIEKGIETAGRPRFTEYSIAAADIAEANFGKKMMANMVVIGFLSAVLGSPSRASMEGSIRGNVPEQTVGDNLRAFELGYLEGLESVRRS